MGDDTRLEFTVLGDTVNVANRLEQTTKEHDIPLIASADTARKAGEDLAQWRDLGMREMNVADLDGHRLRIGSEATGPADGVVLNEEP